MGVNIVPNHWPSIPQFKTSGDAPMRVVEDTPPYIMNGNAFPLKPHGRAAMDETQGTMEMSSYMISSNTLSTNGDIFVDAGPGPRQRHGGTQVSDSSFTPGLQHQIDQNVQRLQQRQRLQRQQEQYRYAQDGHPAASMATGTTTGGGGDHRRRREKGRTRHKQEGDIIYQSNAGGGQKRRSGGGGGVGGEDNVTMDWH